MSRYPITLPETLVDKLVFIFHRQGVNISEGVNEIIERQIKGPFNEEVMFNCGRHHLWLGIKDALSVQLEEKAQSLGISESLLIYRCLLKEYMEHQY